MQLFTDVYVHRVLTSSFEVTKLHPVVIVSLWWTQEQSQDKFITVYYSLNTVGVVSNFIAAYNYTNLVV